MSCTAAAVESEEMGDCYFPCLERLSISSCPQLRQMPKCALPNLIDLEIRDCATLISLPRRLLSLKKLLHYNLDNLEEWCDAVVVGEAHFLCLEELSICRCPRMRRWPNNTLPVLAEFDVSECEGFDGLPSLLPSLGMLCLRGVSNEMLLKSLPSLTSLPFLSITNIPSLTSVPRGILQQLPQLKYLAITDCKELVTLLSEEDAYGLLQQQQEEEEEEEDLPSTLTYLRFDGCYNLKSLPRGLHALTSLHTLEIWNCPHLKSLPDQRLPSSLQKLDISNCPVLKERCMEDIHTYHHRRRRRLVSSTKVHLAGAATMVHFSGGL
ncbi:hypothetical protein ACLOJK_015441, partial [Asimina triloba]